MKWNRYFFKGWGDELISLKALSAILSAFGALWLAIEISTFFFPELIVYKSTKLPDAIRDEWKLFALTGVGIAVWVCKPNLLVAHKLTERDVTIKIAVGDVFSFPGALIIGSNTTFDTRISRDLISASSIQGVFTKKYYGGESQLDAELETRIGGAAFEQLGGDRLGKTKKFPMGHCVRLSPKERTAYFLAIADINEHGVARATFDDLKKSLAQLWVFIGERGLKEPLVMPVLGTGFSRLPQKREEVIWEIIKSFVAACSEKTFADELIIVISPNDMVQNHISLDELGSFLKHTCRYTVFFPKNQQAVGTAI